MARGNFLVESIERVTANGTIERQSFERGLNLLVGRPNTGKTVWLRMLDFVLGDRDPAEQALSEELASRYDSIQVQARAGEEEVTLERRWKEAGAKHKVFLNGNPVDEIDHLGFPTSAKVAGGDTGLDIHDLVKGPDRFVIQIPT